MSIELVVSLIAAVVALGSAVLTAVLSARADARRKQAERQDLMNSIRDPVLWAAFDLQSRLFNIVAQRFLSEFFAHGSAEERTYAKHNTLFVLAQYLGWVEIVRRRVQFLDLGNKQENLRLVNCLSKISRVLTSPSFANSMFRIFRGDQRAIGEIMIDESANGELACIGYAEFCTRIDTDPSFVRWLAPLSTQIEQLATTDAPQTRLVAIQCDVIDLIDILDPESIRFPDRNRRKLSAQTID